jgi:PHD/YefM family antitoxin component YafN of YafNO toxin-antitoxin module
MRKDLDEHSTRSYDASVIAQHLVQLHEHVTRTLGRIEITRPGSDERCVLMSKQELESLERALEILSDTEDVRELAEKIAQLAAVTGPMAAALDA